MISAYAVGMTRPVPVRVTVVPVQAVLDRIRARALEALVLTFALASLVEASLAHGIERRARRRRLGPRLVAAVPGARTPSVLGADRRLRRTGRPRVRGRALDEQPDDALRRRRHGLGLVRPDLRPPPVGRGLERRRRGRGGRRLPDDGGVLGLLLDDADPHPRLVLRRRSRHSHRAGAGAAAARGGRRARPGARGRARDRRGAVTDRTRAARRRCALRLGDGRSGLRCPPSAQGRPGARTGGARLGRADRPAGTDRDETYVGRHADGRRPACGTRPAAGAAAPRPADRAGRGGGPARDPAHRGRAPRPLARRRPVGVPHRPGGADERAQAREGSARRRRDPVYRRTRCSSRSQTTASAPRTALPGGHGLVGMRERVAVYGGTLEAGPREGGGFVLRAELPMESRT